LHNEMKNIVVGLDKQGTSGLGFNLSSPESAFGLPGYFKLTH